MAPPALDAAAWSRIDTVLLDLDGTLLDLVYDNHFWTVMVPEVWGRERGLDLATAQQRLRPLFQARQGTLDWYCIDFWSRELGLDIPAMKVADAHRAGCRGRRNSSTACARWASAWCCSPTRIR
jgi:putative hydrolase of the HAD superfamily